MIIIPGILISAVTFPGVIVHELAHQFFCRIMRVPVYEVKYFQLTNPCGYVRHEPSEKSLTNFMISIGPFLVNTIVGALLLMPVSIELIKFSGLSTLQNNVIESMFFLGNVIKVLAAWLGISILMHSFPSTGDGRALIDSIMKSKDVNIFVKILAAPVVGLIYVGSLGSFFWLDLIYAIGVMILLPSLIAVFL